MKKRYGHTVLSTKQCIQAGCTKRLKLRLVAARRDRNITRCYKHHMAHRLLTQHENSRRTD